MLQELKVDTKRLDTELARSLEQFRRLVEFYRKMGNSKKQKAWKLNYIFSKLNVFRIKTAEQTASRKFCLYPETVSGITNGAVSARL